MLADCPYYTADRMGRYDSKDPSTWWWLWYNHDPASARLNSFVSASSKLTEENPNLYVAYYGTDALKHGH